MKAQAAPPQRRAQAQSDATPAPKSTHASSTVDADLSNSPRMRSLSASINASFGEAAQRQTAPALQQHPADGAGHGVIQAQWDLLVPLLTGTLAGLAGLATYFAYKWWPPGWTLTELRALYQHLGHQDLLTFAALPWPPASVIQLGALHPQISRPDLLALAAMPWTPASVIQLAQAHVAQPNGLTPAEWIAIAQALPANAVADTIGLAQIAGWNGAQLAQLAGDFAAYAGAPPVAARWSAVAAQLPPASRPIVGMLAEPTAPALTPLQIARGQAIFLASGQNQQHVQQWINRGARAAVPPQIPVVHAAAPLGLPGGAAGPLPSPYAIDAVLGNGTHTALRTQIVLHGRPYKTNPFVRQHAQALIAAGMTVANTLTLLTNLCNNKATAAAFDHAVTLATLFHQNQVPFPEANNFIINHPVLADDAAMLPALQNLSARPRVTAALINQILTALAPMGHPQLVNFLTNRLAHTQGLTLARLAARIDHLVLGGPHLGLAPAAIEGNQFQGLNQSLNQRVLNGTMTDAARTSIRAAYSLLANVDQADMMGFIASGSVVGTLHQAQANNAAYWLHQMAMRHRRGAPPGGFVPQQVVVNAAGTNYTFTIDNHIVDHVLRRHSYEHFHLTVPIITRYATSAMYIAGQTPLGVAAAITGTLNSGTFNGLHPWNAGVDIQVGAVQLRLVHLGGTNYRLSQYFIQVAPGLAHNVTQGVLTEIAQRFPELVY